MRATRPVLGRLCAVVLACSALAAGAAGAQERQVEDLLIAPRFVWPAALHKGYYPLFIDLANERDEPREVRLTAIDRYFPSGSQRLEKALVLEPGERRRVELFLSASSFNRWGGPVGYTLQVSIDGDAPLRFHGIGPSESPLPSVRPILWLAAGDQELDPGDVERCESQIAWEEVPQNARHVWSGRLPRHARPAAVNGGAVRLARVAFEDMPARYEAYTSLDAVVVDTGGGLPEEERLEPLLAWARLGGTVAFFGPDATRAVADLRATRHWVEQRFDVGPMEPGVQGWRYGHGLLMASDAPALVGTAQLEALQEALRDTAGWVPSQGTSRAVELGFPDIPGIEDLPYRALTVLLVIFFLVIGPLNFIVLKRLRRPGWLLWTIPTIAFTASALLLAYGIFYQGIDVKTAERSVTVLDQRARTMSTAQVRTMFAGLAPGVGLRLGAGTSVYADRFWLDSPSFLIRATDGIVYSGDYLPARRIVGQVLLSDRASRLRLDFDREEQGFRVENGLGVPLRSLVLRDGRGAWYALVEPVAAGASGALAPAAEGGLEALFEAGALPSIRCAEWAAGREGLRPATYIAVTHGSPFTETGGFEVTEVLGEHAVIGVLPRDEEDWR